jgi:hypothetical protein
MPTDRDALLWMYRTMETIRAFEERVQREFAKGDIPGFVHMYIGEEAVATGVCAHLTDEDFITSTHRGHGHCIAKGCSLPEMLAELYGRETGLCKGRGGSMHIADFRRGMLGANAIVGGGIAIATGGAYLAGYLASLGEGGRVEHGRAMALAVLTLASAALTVALSGLRTWISRAVAAGTVALSVALVQTPVLARLLHLEPLHLGDWILAVVAAILGCTPLVISFRERG